MRDDHANRSAASRARHSVRRRPLALLPLLLLGVAGERSDTRAQEMTATVPAQPAAGARVHGSGRELERAILDAALAFLREDPAGAKRALDGVAASFPGLRVEDEERFGQAVVDYDEAFRVTVNRAREMAGAGALDASFDQFVWIQRTCRICHEQARGAGFDVATPRDHSSGHSGAVADPKH